MRFDIGGLFVVVVVRPSGGWSKGRRIAYVEEGDSCWPLQHVLIPKGLDDRGLFRFVTDRFSGFVRAGAPIRQLPDAPLGQALPVHGLAA